ncbi:MAG: PTS sugar transporter subunit IIA [Planctomycetes bacterium]|nr:PTS sugar transporter subunit IIA [Planctomycetota bacterium]
MKLSELIAEKLVLHPLSAKDKWEAIRLLVRAAVDAGALRAERFEAVHEALVARERSMTTGIEHGVAIPHAAVDGIEDVITVLAIAPAGVPFEALDGRPSRILVCLVIPRHKKLLHIKTLAEIAKLLNRAEVREELLATRDAREVVELVRRREREIA